MKAGTVITEFFLNCVNLNPVVRWQTFVLRGFCPVECAHAGKEMWNGMSLACFPSVEILIGQHTAGGIFVTWLELSSS